MKKSIFVAVVVLASLYSCASRKTASDAYGNFEAEEIVVSAEAQGRLLQFSVEEGQLVNAGQRVGLIDTTMLALKRDQIIAQIRALDANIRGIEARIESQQHAEKNLIREKKRIEKLFSDSAATSRDVDEITTKLMVMEKTIESIRQEREAVIQKRLGVEKQLRQIEESLKRCWIENPVDGTVLEKYCEEHELVVAGRPLYKVADISELILRVYITGSQLPEVKIGQDVEVLIDKDKRKNQSLAGSVVWISDHAEFTPKVIQTKEERVNLVYAVKVRVRNDGRLKIGMPAEVRFKRGKDE